MPEENARASEKLPIYPQPDPELVLVETNTTLEKNIAFARYTTAETYKVVRGRLQSVVERWIGVEHAVEHRLKSFKDVDEALTPGALYVGVATLTGSVLARNRSIFLRLVLPPTLFLVSMNHFLPKMSHNISSYVTALERAHAPALADAHEQLNETVISSSVAARQTLHNIRFNTTKGVERTLSELQNLTGLKLSETFGWTRQAAHKVEDEVKEVVDEVQHKLGNSNK
ncbi:hypothetical protein Clacol_003511 [Clathrus columnatus]|uniref:MICOS complex subunit n=1 Tax=Clathrus columnatus TaxID=1419009 RepID=A0AAV5A7R0_9AGAM|nr:hypothetical protein Clacol_003511 [Clathrus columnatus]